MPQMDIYKDVNSRLSYNDKTTRMSSNIADRS